MGGGAPQHAAGSPDGALAHPPPHRFIRLSNSVAQLRIASAKVEAARVEAFRVPSGGKSEHGILAVHPHCLSHLPLHDQRVLVRPKKVLDVGGSGGDVANPSGAACDEGTDRFGRVTQVLSPDTRRVIRLVGTVRLHVLEPTAGAIRRLGQQVRDDIGSGTIGGFGKQWVARRLHHALEQVEIARASKGLHQLLPRFVPRGGDGGSQLHQVVLQVPIVGGE